MQNRSRFQQLSKGKAGWKRGQKNEKNKKTRLQSKIEAGLNHLKRD